MERNEYLEKTNFLGQINFGTPLTIDMVKKVPAIANRIFETYDAAESYINDSSSSAIPGLTLSVWNDDSSAAGDSSFNMNAVYQVRQSANGGLYLYKLASVDTVEEMVETLEVYRNIHFDRGFEEHRGVNTSEYGNYHPQSNYFGVTADASTIKTNHNIEVIGVTVGNYNHMDVIPADTSVEEILRAMLQKEFGVAKVLPTVTISPSGFVNSGTYEVGTGINYTISDTYNDGYFESSDKGYYTDASFNQINETTGGKLYSLNAVESVDFVPDDSSSIVVEAKDYSFNCTVHYGKTNDDVKPKTNLGNIDVSNGVIPAGTCNSNTLTMHGRYKYFFGYSTNTSYDQFNSAQVRALTALSGWANLTGETVLLNGSSTVTSNGTSVVVACPPGYELNKILDPMTKASYLPNFTSIGTVNVNTGNVVSTYTLYIYPITSGAQVSFTDIRIIKI